MFLRLATLAGMCVLPALCGDWNPRLAADYLDARQKAWFAWPAANAQGVPCVSCHTGLTYLLARPALRRRLGEKEATAYESGLLAAMRSRLEKKSAAEMFPKAKDPAPGAGVESVFAALFLATNDAAKKELSAETEQAFERMWRMQVSEGKAKGSFPWFSLDLDPWEMPESSYFGASMAAIAVGSTPASYRARPEVRERVTWLTSYLTAERESQPLHNRVALLWASTRLNGLLSDGARKALVEEIWKKQQADGGWTMESLGPWKARTDAPASTGSNSYATALLSYVLEESGVKRSDKGLERALGWLRSHQDREQGFWPAESMNKQYKADSMMVQFMRDAATGFATLALAREK